MWSKLFFLYAISVVVLSSIVSVKLSKLLSRKLKYLNEIVLAMSVALVALCVGIVVGASGSTDAFHKHNTFAAISLLVFSLVIEGMLITMVASTEFKNLSSAVSSLPESCQQIAIEFVETTAGTLPSWGDPGSSTGLKQQCYKDLADSKNDTSGHDAKTLIVVMLVLNTIGIIGGIAFQFYRMY